jgi:hypothetical protein
LRRNLTLNFVQKLGNLFHPNSWGWKYYAAILGLLLALNLFGPKGIIHWVLVEQEVLRLESSKERLNRELSDLQAELNRFENSDIAKIRAIQEDLGYLTNDEISFEFTDAIETETTPARAR